MAGQRQERTGSGGTSPTNDPQSDDARQSVEFIAAQQVKQQERINANQHPQIGVKP